MNTFYKKKIKNKFKKDLKKIKQIYKKMRNKFLFLFFLNILYYFLILNTKYIKIY